MKPFLALLYLTPLAFIISAAPILHILWRHILVALSVSKVDPWAKEMWWEWYGSWIFFGGPFGRWIWGTVYGFMVLKTNNGTRKTGRLSDIVEEPHLRLLAIVFPALVISIFALVRMNLVLV